MPKSEKGQQQSEKNEKTQKAEKAPKVTYVVSVEGTEHHVKGDGELKELLLETFSDGVARNVRVTPVEEVSVEDTDSTA